MTNLHHLKMFGVFKCVSDCNLGDIVEPMVWYYQPSFQLPASILL